MCRQGPLPSSCLLSCGVGSKCAPQKMFGGGEAKVGCGAFWATLPGLGFVPAPSRQVRRFSWVDWQSYRPCHLILHDFFRFWRHTKNGAFSQMPQVGLQPPRTKTSGLISPLVPTCARWNLKKGETDIAEATTPCCLLSCCAQNAAKCAPKKKFGGGGQSGL